MKQVIKKIVKSRVFSVVKVLLFVLVCGTIGATAAYIHHESDPTEVAVEYFKAFMKQDYKAMKGLIDVSEDSYLDEKVLGSIIAEQKQDLNVDRYEVLDPTTEDGKDLVVIECSNEETGAKKKFKIYLNSHRNGLSLKPSYKVDFSKYLIDDYTITIPKSDTLQLNGVEVKEEMAEETKEGNKEYHFEQVLKGEYNICSQNQYGLYNKKVEVKEQGTKIQLKKLQYSAKPEYKEKVEEAFNAMFLQYYAAVRKKKAGDKEYLNLFEKAGRKQAKKAVSSSIKTFFNEEQQKKYEIGTMDISDLKTTVAYNKEKKRFDIVATYKINYECTTAVSLINSYTENYSGKCLTTMKATIAADQKEYKIKEITVKNKKKK